MNGNIKKTTIIKNKSGFRVSYSNYLCNTNYLAKIISCVKQTAMSIHFSPSVLYIIAKQFHNISIYKYITLVGVFPQKK